MKNIKIIVLLFLAAIALQSCNDSFLDLKQPINPTLETFYTDSTTAYQGLVGCYNSMQNQGWSNIYLLDTRSDDQDYGGDPTGEGTILNAEGFANFQMYADNIYSSNLWSYGYRGVNTINKYIEGISVLQYPSNPAKQKSMDQFRAEAKFLRAFFYSILVKNFGDVPLITKTLDQADWNQERKPENIVYAQIFKDLREAIPYLPLKSQYNASQYGRITQGAARALLAKTLITNAGIKSKAETQNWQEAYNQCDTIIKSTQYNLNTNFENIFGNAGQFTSEHVFDILFEENMTGERDSYVHALTPRFFFENGKPVEKKGVAAPTFGGFGMGGITENMANQYLAKIDSSGGPGNYQNVYYNQSNTDSIAYLKMLDIRGRYTFWTRFDKYLGLSVVDKHISTIDNAQKKSRNDNANYYQRKYNRESVNFTNWAVSGTNYHYIRYSEVVLLCAEAAYYLGKEIEAQTLLNSVRERAFRNAIADKRVTLSSIQKTSTGTVLLNDIWQERRLELSGEADRFYDLKRTGRLSTVLPAEKPGILFEVNKSELLPIPSSEISKSPNITQNPNY